MSARLEASDFDDKDPLGVPGLNESIFNDSTLMNAVLFERSRLEIPDTEDIKEKPYLILAGLAPKKSYLELTITDDISTDDLTKLLSSLNRLHKNLSPDSKPIDIESIKIGIPDFEYTFSGDPL